MDREKEKIVREVLSRKDPRGFYVITAHREALEVVGRLRGVSIEESGDTLIIMTRSRSLAEKILRMLMARNLYKPA